MKQKVKDILSTTQVDDGVYNGNIKINEQNKNFMQTSDVRKAILSLKLKNSEGFDRIPQRILMDGIDVLITPFEKLFELIYSTNTIPEQWGMSKITPIHKKGEKNNIRNYRPIANLCEATKIYERLILQRIQEIEKEENIDLTGKNQHGFKRELF